MTRAITLLLLLVPSVALAGGDGGHGFNAKEYIFFVIHFVAFAGILFWAGRSGVTQYFANRRATISRELEEAQSLRDQAVTLLAEHERRRAELEAEVEDILKRFKEDGEREKQRVLADARKEAARLRKDAEIRISQEAKKAEARLRQQAIELALEVAERVITEKLDDAARDRLFDDAVKELEKIRPEQVIAQ